MKTDYVDLTLVHDIGGATNNLEDIEGRVCIS